MQVTRAAILLAAVLLFSPSPARADTCASPDLLDSMPPPDAQTVPTNASLFARYGTTAEYLGEKVTLVHVGTGEEALPASWDATEGLLRITPTVPLVEGHEYIVKWPGLRGLNSANLGHGRDVRFRVGKADAESPKFAGLGSIWWDVRREHDPCTNSVEDRYVFDVDVGTASDDGGRESLTLLVFQTAGSGAATGAPKPVLVTQIPPAGEKVHVVAALGRGEGKVCFAAITRDLTGRISTGNVETCTETVAPPFFYGCSTREGAPATGTASTETTSTGTVWVISMGLVSWLWRRRRYARG